MEIGIESSNFTRPKQSRAAGGKPGRQPHWSSGAKTLVATSACNRSRLWYSIGRGTLNELFYDDLDQANTRSIRFLISDGKRFFSDEAEDATHRVTWSPEAPTCRIQTRDKRSRYILTKEIVTDPMRGLLLMRVRFRPKAGSNLRLFLFMDPHVGDKGADNDAWAGNYKGTEALFAKRGGTALAVTSTAPMVQASCGYIGVSDGLTRLSQFKDLPASNSAAQGNVALTAELDYRACGGRFVVTIGFEGTPAGAGQQAITGVAQDFDQVARDFGREWSGKQANYKKLKDLSGSKLDMYRVSTTVLETHQSKRFPGGFIASLSAPWGFARSDEDIAGYHVVWPRDMGQTAMAKLASEDAESARSTLFYLQCTQNDDGGWSQNMWLDGTPHGKAIQMDGVSMPILLADSLRRSRAMQDFDQALSLVRKAAGFLLCHGPVTEQERWENLAGYSVYSMAAQVAALLAAADFLSDSGDKAAAGFLRRTADAWNDAIDELTYVTGTRLARAQRVEGYYIRIAPPKRIERDSIDGLTNTMADMPPGQAVHPAVNIVSPDALGLVRLGLRAPDDPRIRNTVKIVDKLLKRQMKTGPGWVRSTKDSYGEHADGSPFNKTGVGRCWPLLAGERGHYELAAGRRAEALKLLKTMARQAGECGMIPEQVWDGRDIPRHQLFNGCATGSSMPLVWAHAEYIKLLRSLHEGRVWDTPPQPVKRYQKEKRVADFQIWTTQQQRGWLAAGKDLRIDLQSPAAIHWEAGKQSGEVRTSGCLGLHSATIQRNAMADAAQIRFRITPDDTASARITRETFVIRRAQD